MKILVAEEAGFCFGVKRALKLINEYLQKGNKIQTFGPLIHNVPVLNNLAAMGVSSVSSVEEIEKNKTLCIRTHGIPREVEKYIAKKRHHHPGRHLPAGEKRTKNHRTTCMRKKAGS